MTITIGVIGDSISVGCGATEGNGYVDQLQKKFALQGKPVKLINKSIGGITTQRAVELTNALFVETKPDYVLFFLGMNDCLQAKTNPNMTIENLKNKIITNLDPAINICIQNSVKVILGGIIFHLKGEYNQSLAEAYSFLIKKHQCLPVMLLGHDVLLHMKEKKLKIHPNDIGAGLIAQKLFYTLDSLEMNQISRL